MARAHAGRGGNAALAGTDPSGAHRAGAGRNGSGGVEARDGRGASFATDAPRQTPRASGVILRRPRMDVVARVLWSTASAASVLEVDRSSATREWFDDLALGCVVLPAHALVLPEGVGPWRSSALDAHRADLVRVDVDQLAHALAEGGGVRADGVVVRERARWMHPALRSAATGVDAAPFVHGWINLAAFVEPGQRSAFAGEAGHGAPGHAASRGLGATNSAVDWVGLRACVRRCVRLFDGLLEVHAGEVHRDPVPASDRELASDLEWRRIGLGVAGLGETFAQLGIDPGSTAAAQTARRLALCVTDNAHRKSIELGASRGVFPRYEETLWARTELVRRHGLVTCSWASDGLLAASGLGEGVVATRDADRDAPAVAPALLDQVRVQMEVQRAFEGVALIDLAVGTNHDAGVFERVATERDVQAVRCSERRAAPPSDELRPAPRATAATGPATTGPAKNGSAASGSPGPAHSANGAPERPRFVPPPSSAADGYTIAPALRLDARTPRGPWSLDVVYDEDGLRELELVLVQSPPGADGWRLIDGVNAALRDGAANLAEALDRASAETGGATDLTAVLRRFARRDRVEA